MMVFMSFISGLIFALGLGISGMVNPDKVIGFLDIFGEWDYALTFVMGGAVILNLITFRLIKRNKNPMFAEEFHWPTAKDIDKKLVVGSIMFGVGWGLIGICPGPGIVNLVTLEPKVLVFVGSMVLGMVVYKFLPKI